MYTVNISNEDELSSVAINIINLLSDKRILLFSGEMGSGKTTLIKFICKHLGVLDLVNSPTFSIVNEYRTINKEIIYHFDFYRIKDSKEVFDMGYEEYFFSSAYCFVEWPEKVKEILPSNVIHITINLQNSERILNIAL